MEYLLKFLEDVFINTKAIFTVLLLVLAVSTFAAGREDNVERTVENIASWQETFDISEREEGKYNILITATDAAGNISNAGPFNVFVDPESDLPITGITNPFADSIIVGNLNIVGTAIDDDAVAYVELILNGNVENPIRAQGTEFWSYFLDTSDMEEGVHTIEAYSVDINGIKGHSATTTWQLNRKQPVTLVENLALGQLVSGKITLAGKVEDGNGIKYLEYSLDRGETFIPLKLKYLKNENEWTFTLPIDTTKLVDGPSVVWFKSEDEAGSSNIYTWLCFVDNTKPVVSLLYPEEGKVENGIFSISGLAQDSIGIQSLSWFISSELNGEIPLLAGNPYWTVDLDLRNFKSAKANVAVAATDVAGNITIIKQDIEIDSEADKPIVTVQFPPQNYVVTDDLYLRGIVNDDDGVARILYSLNGQAEVSLDTDGVFYADIPLSQIPLLEGKNTLSVRAEDIHGIISDEVVIPFVHNKKPVISNPTIMIDSRGEALNYVYGMSIKTAPDSYINYTIEGTEIKEAAWRFANSVENYSELKSPSDKVSLKIPLANAPLGVLPLHVYAVDTLGREVNETIVLYIERQSQEIKEVKLEEGEEPPPPPLLKLPITNTYTWIPDEAVKVLPSGSYVLTAGTVINGYADFPLPIEAEITSVGMGSDASSLSLSVNQNIVSLSANIEGFYSDVQVTITDSQGVAHQSDPISLFVSNEVPTLVVDSSLQNKWVQDTVTLFGTASDVNGIQSLSYSLDLGESWTDISLQIDDSWSTDIFLGGYDDGLITVDIRAKSNTEKESIERIAIIKDTVAPEVTVIAPPAGSLINGETTLVFNVQDNGGKLILGEALPSVLALLMETEDSLVSRENVNLELKPLITHLTGGREHPLQDDMAYRFTDAAGNSTIIDRYDFQIDTTSDLPVVEINVPMEDSLITTGYKVSGVSFDDDGVSDIFISIDGGGYFQIANDTNSFSYPISFDDLLDNEHSISMYAVDMYGVRGEEVTVNLRVSREEPAGEVTKPALDETVHGITALSGIASDNNGIAQVFVSLDNGNSYNLAEGTEIWQYVFDTRLMQDGSHVVFLKIVDSYGVESIYSSLINIDNTAPMVQIDLPLDGASIAENLFVSGQASDNINLESLSVRISSLNGETNVPEVLRYIELKPDVVIAEVIDTSFLANGTYNIEVIAEDVGGNRRSVSKNIEKDSTYLDATVDLMYPLSGKYVNGVFNVYGRASSSEPISQLVLFVDGLYTTETTITKSGYFKFEVTPEMVAAGERTMYVRAITASGEQIDSNVHSLNYIPFGPWITIDNFTMGDFAIDRPWLEGSAGYAITEQDLIILESSESTRDEKNAIYDKTVEKIEISFDNGKTFEEIGKSGKWRYRIEDGYLAEGYHFLVVRATMKNRDQAVTRSIIRIDKTKPNVELISPGEGGRFNNELDFVGLSSDDIELENVDIALRVGDKTSYGVPAFIQGLYIDVHFLGITLFDVGVGLSFFDDNVKLQFQAGQLTQAQFEILNKTNSPFRYGGTVLGGKLLANVATIPFGSFAGPDWQWLSASFALGANFSYFSETQSGKPQMLSAVLLQIEFPRVTIPKQQFFNTFSFYTEGQLWFIPTDVQSSTVDIASLVPQIAIGIRANVF